MVYRIRLNTGETIDVNTTSFNVKVFTDMLNDHSTTFINIENTVINKHIILTLIPIETKNITE